MMTLVATGVAIVRAGTRHRCHDPKTQKLFTKSRARTMCCARSTYDHVHIAY
jgi:hypothetical protein